MKEIILNNLDQPLIMSDLVHAAIIMLTLLSLTVVAVRYVRNHIVEHREGILKAVEEMKAEAKKLRDDPEIKSHITGRAMVAIASLLASSIRFVTNVACLRGEVHWTVTNSDGTKHEEVGMTTWWGPGMKDIIWFVLLSTIGAAILNHYTEQLPIVLAWALWIAFAWVIIWDFPNAGLNQLERSLIYGMPGLVGQLAADVMSSMYYYTIGRTLRGLAVFLSFKHILLPIYAPQNAIFLENVIFFAIVAHFIWYIPYFGPRAIWQRLPTSFWNIEAEVVRGKDMPAKVHFNISDDKVKIDISDCTMPIRGYGNVWVLRNGWRPYWFEFEVKPGKEFSTQIDVHREYTTWDPIWCTKMVLHAVVSEKDISVREYLPEGRGVKQRIMEHVFRLSMRVWNIILGTKSTCTD